MIRLRSPSFFNAPRQSQRSPWRWCVLVVAWLLVPALLVSTEAAETWRFDGADGISRLGDLSRFDAVDIAFSSADGEVKLPAVGVRVVEPAEKPPVAAARVRLWLSDGSLLAGDALETSGRNLVLEGQGFSLTVPQQAVAKTAWDLSGLGLDPLDLAAAPDWQSMVPPAADSDLIVIRKAAEPEPVYQTVPCAILSVDAEHVTVALDEDRIPVKRERVAGLVWLRAGNESQTAGPVVDFTGGRLFATEVRYLPERGDFQISTAWSSDLVIPAAFIRRIDLAAGRTVSLVTLPPEETGVEPFFAGLAELEELTDAFQPRFLTAEQAASLSEGGPLILAMPRTVMRWKLPAGVQRLRMQADVERSQAGGGDLVVIVDGRELLRREIPVEVGEADRIDVDVAGGRRLELIVDFPADSADGQSGLGRLRLHDPRLEK